MSPEQQPECLADPAVNAAAQPLRLLLSCPKCKVSGWIKWSSLKRGIRCPKCRCEFLIGSTGQMHKLKELPQTRFTCPRCGKSGSIAATFVVKKAECGDCKLTLVPGPDRKLHGVREAAELHRAAKAHAPRSYRGWLEANFRRADGRLNRGYVVSVVCLTIALALTAGFLVRSLFDNSPETLALRLTAKCLAGDFKSAERYLPDDDVQWVEFERWRMRHFASIIQKFRPAGDRVGMGATPLEQLASKATFQIEMQSDFFGTRKVKQVWVCDEDGVWRFDVCETLAVEDGQHAPRLAPTESATAGVEPKR